MGNEIKSKQEEMNPRYIAYLKTTDKPTNYDYMVFIGFMKTKYLVSKGDSFGSFAIDDDDDFTKFIEKDSQEMYEMD